MTDPNSELPSAQQVAALLDEAALSISRAGLWMMLAQDDDLPNVVIAALSLGGYGGQGLHFWNEQRGDERRKISEQIPELGAAYLRDVADRVETPWLRAKLLDVAWCLDPRDQESVRDAVTAYLLVTDEYELDNVGRADAIACFIGDEDLMIEADERLQELYVPDPSTPGENIGVLRIAFEHRDPPEDWAVQGARESMLAFSEMKMADQDGVGELAKFLGPFERRNSGEEAEKDVWREVVRAKIRFGSLATGATRIGVLRAAENLAKDRGLVQLRQECQTLLAGEDLRDHLQEVRVEVPVDEDFLRQLDEWQGHHADSICSQSTVLEGLQRFASIPLYNPSDFVEPPPKTLADMFTTTTISGGKESVAQTAEELAELRRINALMQYAQQSASMLLAPVVLRLEECWNPADVTRALTGSPFIPEVAAIRVGSAFRLFWEERFDEAAHVLAPTIERMMREFGYASGALVKPAPSKGQDSTHPQLGTVLAALKPPLLTQYLQQWLPLLLTSVPGLNLRNGIAHGESALATAQSASTLLQAACVPSLFIVQYVAVDSEE